LLIGARWAVEALVAFDLLAVIRESSHAVVACWAVTHGLDWITIGVIKHISGQTSCICIADSATHTNGARVALNALIFLGKSSHIGNGGIWAESLISIGTVVSGWALLGSSH
jgi:hypothetical protein